MHRFYDDRLIDRLELAQLLRKMAVHGGSKPSPALEQEIFNCQAEIATAAGIVANGRGHPQRLHLREVCKDAGMEDYYTFWFGLLSKFAHPTQPCLSNWSRVTKRRRDS